MTPEKAICKYDRKQIRENLREFALIVAEPEFICRKCGRAASEKESLCRPVKLKKLLE